MTRHRSSVINGYVSVTDFVTYVTNSVTSYVASLPIALRHTLKSGIELAVYRISLVFVRLQH
jgi:hypothetical protein